MDSGTRALVDPGERERKIDLTSEQKGKYTLEIQLPTEVFSGEFELEN